MKLFYRIIRGYRDDDVSFHVAWTKQEVIDSCKLDGLGYSEIYEVECEGYGIILKDKLNKPSINLKVLEDKK